MIFIVCGLLLKRTIKRMYRDLTAKVKNVSKNSKSTKAGGEATESCW